MGLSRRAYARPDRSADARRVQGQRLRMKLSGVRRLRPIARFAQMTNNRLALRGKVRIDQHELGEVEHCRLAFRRAGTSATKLVFASSFSRFPSAGMGLFTRRNPKLDVRNELAYFTIQLFYKGLSCQRS